MASGCAWVPGPDYGSPMVADAGAPVAVIAIDKTMADFGAVVVGESTHLPVVFTIRNDSAAVTGPVHATVTGDFSFSITCGASGLTPHTSCTATLLFKPTAAGARMGTFTVAASPGGQASTILSGTGLQGGDLIVTPNLIAFPSTIIDEISREEVVTIRNDDPAPRTISVSLADPAHFVFTTTCKGPLEPLASCFATVVFTPVSVGKKITTLMITADGQSLTVNLTGTALLPAKLDIQPSSLDVFGIVNQQSSPVTLTVTNLGDVPTGLVTVALAGATPDDFVVTANGCIVPLAPQATCTISLVLRPSVFGVRIASLLVSAMPGGMTMATLLGDVSPPEGPLGLTPASPIDLGLVGVGMESAPMTVTVKNFGPGTTSPLIVALASTEFTKAMDTCSGVALPANGSCTIDIRIIATSSGVKSAVLVVSAGVAGQGVVTLTATAQ
jgi:hypothetical protein